MGTGDISAKVFVTVWRPAKQTGHLDLVIVKQYLLTTKPVTTDMIYHTVLGRVSGRTGGTVWAQDGVSYVNSCTSNMLL